MSWESGLKQTEGKLLLVPSAFAYPHQSFDYSQNLEAGFFKDFSPLQKLHFDFIASHRPTSADGSLHKQLCALQIFVPATPADRNAKD